MFRTILLAAIALAAVLPAQRSLADLRARLEQERAEFFREKQGRPTFQDIVTLGERHAELVSGWLPEARGADAVNGRLLLADIRLNIGQEDRAKGVLRGIDIDKAPALELVAAAEMAGMLSMDAERTAWLDAAIAKEAPFEARMTLALFLMTRLQEIDKGESIFAAASAAATDDEGRAKVAWFRAAALRAREDLEDGAFEQALEDLAERYPDTYWGSVARDRRRAFDLEPGAPAIPFGAKTLDGAAVKLADYAGKVLLLDFWTTSALRGRSTHEALAAMRTDYGEKGFAILGVAMDPDRAIAESTAKGAAKAWPQVFDGRGFMTDLALRYGIEQVPDHVLIGRDGKIAAIRIFLQDDYGVRELRDAIAQALARE